MQSTTTMDMAPMLAAAPAEPLAGPGGQGQGPLRDLLSLVARKSDAVAWRVDGGDWRRHLSDHDMLHASTRALRMLGIADGERVEQTDSPVRFAVSGPTGRREIELAWDTMSDDLMSMPPHVKVAHPAVRALVLASMGAACWGAIGYAVWRAVAG